MAPGACGEAFRTNLTGVVISIINYHPVSPRKSQEHRASLCLGENPSLGKLLDLHCSFEAIVNAEYGGRNHLHFTTQNYVANVKKEGSGVSGITYEKALRNLIVTCTGIASTIFDVTPPLPDIGACWPTIVWRLLQSWAATTMLSDAWSRTRPCQSGSLHQRFRQMTPGES